MLRDHAAEHLIFTFWPKKFPFLAGTIVLGIILLI